MTGADLLELHRGLVAIPSVSHDESRIAGHVASLLREAGHAAERFGDNVWAAVGEGPALWFNTHLDTVPRAEGWTRAPHVPCVEAGRVYGLGSNDAKASAAAMIAAFVRLSERPPPGLRVVLTLAAQEETGGGGTEALLPELTRRGLAPGAVVVGEPTGLDVAVAQKGLLVLEVVARGQGCHAAHARALGRVNPIRRLARDLLAADDVDLGAPHPLLGAATLEPTVASAGRARNAVPGEARCVLDVRTNPNPTPDEIVARLRAALQSELEVRSDRLRPCELDPSHPLVAAALEVRPGARTFGSRGVSDLVHFRGVPGIKVGPGETERSHTPDEYVLESEVLEGARFYEGLAHAYGARLHETETP